LWTAARAVPSLDLRFAGNKSLVDAVTGSSLVTFTRASSGTYVGSDGVLRSAVTNLLLRSEEFGTTWSPSNTTVSPDAIVAPNGTLTADKIIATTTNGAHQLFQGTSGTSGVTYTISFYVKEGEYKRFKFGPGNAAVGGADKVVEINLALSNPIVSQEAIFNSSAFVLSVGDGWYRVGATFTATATGTMTVAVLQTIINNAGSSSFAGDGTSGLFLWGAQLQQASTVGEYIPTTSAINSAPRFDHNPTTGESLGLLVEEARTNFATQSESFSGWTVGNLVQSTATVTSPSGGSTVQLFVEDTATSPHRLFLSPTTGQLTNSFSVWVKPASGTRLFYIESDGPTGTRRNLRFNLQAGTVDFNPGDWTNPFITAYANGWFKVGGTITDNGGSVLFIVGNSNGAVSSYTGDGTSGFYLWGAQLEAGAFPTSYIPTTTATVTRAADVASITGSNFSSWYNQTEGTVFFEGINPAVSTTAFAVSDGSTNNRLQMETGTNTRVARVVSGGTTQAGNNIAYTYGASQKFAMSYVTNSINFANAGTLGTEDTSATIPTVDQARIGANPTGANPLNNTIKRLTYWPVRFAGTTLQQITQP
jgi:hypothetical protein